MLSRTIGRSAGASTSTMPDYIFDNPLLNKMDWAAKLKTSPLNDVLGSAGVEMTTFSSGAEIAASEAGAGVVAASMAATEETAAEATAGAEAASAGAAAGSSIVPALGVAIALSSAFGQIVSSAQASREQQDAAHSYALDTLKPGLNNQAQAMQNLQVTSSAISAKQNTTMGLSAMFGPLGTLGGASKPLSAFMANEPALPYTSMEAVSTADSSATNE